MRPGRKPPSVLSSVPPPTLNRLNSSNCDAKSIRVGEYLTELPPLKLLQARLHQALEHAREQAARGHGDAAEVDAAQSAAAAGKVGKREKPRDPKGGKT